MKHPTDYLVNAVFGFSERFGIHITRNHFYSPVPDTRQLKDSLWQRGSDLVGLDLRDDSQLALLELLANQFRAEYDELRRSSVSKKAEMVASPFSPADSAMLYYMVRHFQPARIMEIGSGASTLVSAQALLRNQEISGRKSELIAIEPYPNRDIKRGFAGLTGLITKKVEDVELAEFSSLQANDVLFIDSSHVVRIGNDVQYEYLDILPRLRKGVVVHIHDIFFPQEYPRKWVLGWKCFWNEQYLVQAFLAFNSAFEILWAGNYLRLKYPERLRQAFTGYNPETGGTGSLWIRKTL